MLLHDSRREARTDAAGELVLLEDQDRSLWDAEEIEQGLALAERALRSGGPVPTPCRPPSRPSTPRRGTPAETDWRQIVALYDALYRLHPTPVVALNRAVAVAMADGPEGGLALIDSLASSGALDGYHFLYAARADLLRRLGRADQARTDYETALRLATNPVERSFLARPAGAALALGSRGRCAAPPAEQPRRRPTGAAIPPARVDRGAATPPCGLTERRRKRNIPRHPPGRLQFVCAAPSGR